MVINDLCERFENTSWIDGALDSFISNVPWARRAADRPLSGNSGPYEKIEYLVDFCDPPFPIEEIAGYLNEQEFQHVILPEVRRRVDVMIATGQHHKLWVILEGRRLGDMTREDVLNVLMKFEEDS